MKYYSTKLWNSYGVKLLLLVSTLLTGLQWISNPDRVPLFGIQCMGVIFLLCSIKFLIEILNKKMKSDLEKIEQIIKSRQEDKK